MRKLVLLVTALTLGVVLAPVAASPALASSIECTAGGYSLALPPYHTFTLVGEVQDSRLYRYWIVTADGSYVRSYVAACSGSSLVSSTNLSITSTSGDRCDPSTSSFLNQYVGEKTFTEIRLSPFGWDIVTVRYRYWHMRRIIFAVPSAFVVYDHSELARC